MSEAVATHFLNQFAPRFDRLLELPFMGAKRPELASELRMVLHRSYAIYYLPRGREVIIVRVLHNSRDVTTIAAEEGFII